MTKQTLTKNTKIKLNNGVEMPIFGLGLYMPEGIGSSTVPSIVHAIKNAGYIMLDSAEFYGNEAEVGEAIRASGLPRDQIFVTTKIFTTAGGRTKAIATVDKSLKLMDIGYIDQYLIHAPQGGHVLETYDVLLEYQRKGLIKTVGVSNFGVAHLEALKNSGRPLPQVNQIELHPWCLQEDICKWCVQHGVALVGYAPLVRNEKKGHPLLVELAKKYNKSEAHVLIRYSLEKGWVTIPKSAKIDRIDENSDVFDFSLDERDLQRLNQLGKDEERICWNPTVNDIEKAFGPTK